MSASLAALWAWSFLVGHIECFVRLMVLDPFARELSVLHAIEQT